MFEFCFVVHKITSSPGQLYLDDVVPTEVFVHSDMSDVQRNL